MKIWNLAALSGVCAAAVLLFTACAVWKMDADKIRDIEYTVADKSEIPEELKNMIEKKKGEEMKLCYADNGYLYAVRGYGVQKTSGYSIEVLQCYEGSHAVYIETGLMGPDRAEEVTEADTYPYIVIRMEYMDKQIVFE